MAKIEQQVHIAASPTTVFRFCHDPEKRAEWDERVAKVKVLTRGPIRTGSLIRVDASQPGGPLFTWDAEYVSFQFPLSSKLRVFDAAPSSPFKSGTEIWRFDAEGGGTRFTLTWDYKPRNWIAAIFDFLWRRRATRRAIQNSLANLESMIEAD